jgi:hypothetical protein
MSKQKQIALFVVGALTLCIIGIRLFINSTAGNGEEKGRSSRFESANHSRQTRPLATPTVRQVSLKEQTRKQALEEWWRRREKDKLADWKTPISFYGRAVDQDMHSVPGASVRFEWTDLSPKGTSTRQTTADANGFFSLANAEGKNLGVYISKAGYVVAKKSKARAFEFGDPSEPNFYEPDAKNPVLFVLRKTGQGVPLVRRSVEVVLPRDGSSQAIDLATGRIQTDGNLSVQSWKPWPPRPASPPYDWKIQLTMSGGGFIEAPEEFAFEAPETGYSPIFELIEKSENVGAWKVSADQSLYFKLDKPDRYGRMKIRTDGNSRYVFIDYFFNPSGSRNLEFDPAREIKTH